jgi:hypothetical protein
VSAPQAPFVTRVELTAPVLAVVEASLDPRPWVTDVRAVEAVVRLPDRDGARRYRTSVRVPGYQLVWEMAAELVSPTTIRWAATGDLDGHGRWELTAMDDAVTGILSMAWLRTTRPWMQRAEPVLRPWFLRNHHRVMRGGVEALATHLGAEVRRHEVGRGGTPTVDASVPVGEHRA